MSRFRVQHPVKLIQDVHTGSHRHNAHGYGRDLVENRAVARAGITSQILGFSCDGQQSVRRGHRQDVAMNWRRCQAYVQLPRVSYRITYCCMSILLKSVICEFECPAVLVNVADEFVAGAVGKLGLNFDGDFDF